MLPLRTYNKFGKSQNPPHTRKMPFALKKRYISIKIISMRDSLAEKSIKHADAYRLKKGSGIHPIFK